MSIFQAGAKPTSKARRWKNLPSRAANLLEGTRELTGADLSIVSVGPAREQTIFL